MPFGTRIQRQLCRQSYRRRLYTSGPARMLHRHWGCSHQRPPWCTVERLPRCPVPPPGPCGRGSQAHMPQRDFHWRQPFRTTLPPVDSPVPRRIQRRTACRCGTAYIPAFWLCPPLPEMPDTLLQTIPVQRLRLSRSPDLTGASCPDHTWQARFRTPPLPAFPQRPS